MKFKELFTEVSKDPRMRKSPRLKRPAVETPSYNGFKVQSTSKIIKSLRGSMYSLASGLVNYAKGTNRAHKGNIPLAVSIFGPEASKLTDQEAKELLISANKKIVSLAKSKPIKRAMLSFIEEMMEDAMYSAISNILETGSLEDLVAFDYHHVYTKRKTDRSSSGSIDRKESWNEIEFWFAGNDHKITYNHESSAYDNNYYS